MKLKLLPQSDLICTGPVDHADWNYHRFLGLIFLQRYYMLLSLLPKNTSRLLEIGYGSGIFLPELATHTQELYGIDIHDKTQEVSAALKKNDVKATILQADAAQLPFPDAYFDTIVSVSTLEFIDHIKETVSEIKRVLKNNGKFLIVMPGTSPILDLGLFILTGESAKSDYGDRRRHVLPELKRQLRLEATKTFIPFLPIYSAHLFSKSSIT